MSTVPETLTKTNATLAKMTATPLELPLRTKDINGVEVVKTYRLAPLTQADFGEFELWMQSQYIDGVKKHTADMKVDERIALLDKALRRAVEITIISDEGVRIMNTLDGIKKLVFISLRREHADVTMDEVSRLMMNSEVARLILEKVDWINGGRTKPVNPPKAPRVKLRRGRKKM